MTLQPGTKCNKYITHGLIKWTGRLYTLGLHCMGVFWVYSTFCFGHFLLNDFEYMIQNTLLVMAINDHGCVYSVSHKRSK